MKTAIQLQMRKCVVDLSLDEDLVRRARFVTDNLSGVVESLLTEFIERELRQRQETAGQAATTIALWNAYEAQHGAFSDDHSTL